MFRRFSPNYMAILFLFDGLIIQLAFISAMQLRTTLPVGRYKGEEFGANLLYASEPSLHIAIGALWLLVFLSLSVYSPRKVMRWYDETQRVLLAHTVAALSLAGLLYMANIVLLRLTYGYYYLLALTTLLGYRFLLRAWHRLQHNDSAPGVSRILVVGAEEVGAKIVAEFAQQSLPGIKVVGFLDDVPEKKRHQLMGIPILGPVNAAVDVIHHFDIDEVIIALPPSAHSRIANLVAALYVAPVRVHVVPDYFELAFFGATVDSLGGIPLIGLRDPAIDGFQRMVKRIVDLMVAAFGLIVLSPLFAAVAVIIKLEDRGSILYTATRLGENGTPFEMLKFRSMVEDADNQEYQIYDKDDHGDLIAKGATDPRITRIGSFIRRTSIDELPQLINVLRGDMSLVGPRPELPRLVDKYELWQRKRFAVPQGMTGWWQVNGRSENPMHLHTDQDLYYIQNYSLWLDFQIMWRTINVVLRGRGAY